MKRFAAILAVLLALPFAAHAQEVSAWRQSDFTWKPMVMRNSSTASGAVVNRLWTSGQNTTGFLDSMVFRRGATTATVYDTTMGYDLRAFRFPPNFGPSLSNALVDTSSVPWVIIRVRQDTTQAGYTAASGLDSVRVGAEYSYNGINWFSCPGTNTRRFDTVFFTSGEDGLQSPSLIGVEASPGEDAAFVTLSCHPSQATSNSFITNRTLCLAGGYVRFVIGGDYSGQFVVEYAAWNP